MTAELSSVERELRRVGAPAACGRGERGRFVSVVPALHRFGRNLSFDPATGCVMWTGGTTSGRGHSAPYGSFWDEGRRWFAHRWAAKHIHGLDIDGYQVDHCCPHTGGLPNTLCVEHLQALTPHEHVAFGQARKFIYVQVGLEEADPVYEPVAGAPALFRASRVVHAAQARHRASTSERSLPKRGSMTRDSGRLPQGEDSRSEAECEASQSGDAEGGASPNPSPTPTRTAK